MSWFEGLEHIIREQEPMAQWNSLRLGGPAEFFAEPTTAEELQLLLRRAQAADQPVRVLGGGSNVLVRDAGVSGVVVHLSAAPFCQVEANDCTISAGGGAKLMHVVAAAARCGLAGPEALVGIPGTVGGALRHNASGHGAAIGQWAHSVSALSMAGEPVQMTADELRFGYRESNLNDLVILQADLRMEQSDPVKVTRQMQKLWIMKRSSQPTGEFGFAQVFANSRGMTAGQIIEQAGLRGTSVGKASVCEADANYVEVQPGASSDDVLGLIDSVRQQVSTSLGVELMPDIQVW